MTERERIMREITNWLIGIEQLAGNLYRGAAEFFRDDKELAPFLANLAEDEAWHFHIMGSAAQYLQGKPDGTSSPITLDEHTKNKIETPFTENQSKLSDGSLTEESLMACIVATEFSEWNELFLYVVNTLKEESREFQYVAARMQGHLKKIEQFVESRPQGRPFLENIRNLPPVWQNKFLIVEDERSIVELLRAVLSKEGDTEVAYNGKQALEKIEAQYFDVIICDVGLPVMDGIESYNRAVKLDPEVGKRFLFFTGLPTPENITFFEKENLRYLIKPTPLIELRQVVIDMLNEKVAQRS